MIALAICAIALSILAAGAVARELLVALGGYVLVVFSMGRARSVLHAIDAGDLARDGRMFASIAWILAMTGSALSVLALLYAFFG